MFKFSYYINFESCDVLVSIGILSRVNFEYILNRKSFCHEIYNFVWTMDKIYMDNVFKNIFS